MIANANWLPGPSTRAISPITGSGSACRAATCTRSRDQTHRSATAATRRPAHGLVIAAGLLRSRGQRRRAIDASDAVAVGRQPPADASLPAADIQGALACVGEQRDELREVQTPVVDVVIRRPGPRQPLLSVPLPGVANVLDTSHRPIIARRSDRSSLHERLSRRAHDAGDLTSASAWRTASGAVPRPDPCRL